jgi:geranylgeranyl diphosphate synthase type II
MATDSFCDRGPHAVENKDRSSDRDRHCNGAGRVAPPRLASALDYAVNPGGARIRPTICMSVAMACGDTNPAMSDAAATAIELIHCASLVHDDMPCFDNADIRRGKPTVHRAYGSRWRF